MKKSLQQLLLTAALAVALPVAALAQDGDISADSESLKMAAIEALMAAPPERALPVVKRLLTGNQSAEIKSRALFILGQIDLPEAHEALLTYAKGAEPGLQLEAIRMIGISGNEALTAQLDGIYASGDPRVREAALEAWMIAGDEQSVFMVAANATSDAEFEAAVHQLGVMGATEQLKQLRDRPGASESLVHAYAVAGDTDSLVAMARDSSDPERQLAALQGLGIAGGAQDSGVFVDIYQSTDDPDIREAVREGILIAGDDESALQLFKAATDDAEKAELLRLLVIMGSDAAMDAIDHVLDGDDL